MHDIFTIRENNALHFDILLPACRWPRILSYHLVAFVFIDTIIW